ncbi:MAG: hypothetical protein ACR2H5_00395 [Ktedonobacteraceae bacterium]
MSIKLFILGRPGSGKSTAFRYIEEYLRQRYSNWTITRYNDYDILQEMSKREKLFPPKKKKFETKELDGFDVLDFTVLDEVLSIIEKSVRARSSKKKEELVIIEFARQDYNQALGLFSDSFLKDSYFLFLDADLKVCVQRVKDRVTFPPTPDNHFVSDNILTGYYGKQVIPPVIKTKKGEWVDKDRTGMISNCGSLHELRLKIEDFIYYIMADSLSITQPHPIVPIKQRRALITIPHPLFTFSNHKKAAHKVQSTKTWFAYKMLQKKYQGKHKSSTLQPSDR